MKQEKFTTTSVGEITLILLDLDEWDDFIVNLKNAVVLSIESNITADEKQINAISRNKCVPMITNDGFIKQSYKAETKYVSIIHGMLGKYVSRLWWARNNDAQNTAKVEEEIGDNRTNALRKFIVWWNKSKNAKNTLQNLKERSNKFDTYNVSTWIESLPGITYETDNMPIKNRNDVDLMNFAYIKSWTLATELIVLWMSSKLIDIDNEGKCSILSLNER